MGKRKDTAVSLPTNGTKAFSHEGWLRSQQGARRRCFRTGYGIGVPGYPGPPTKKTKKKPPPPPHDHGRCAALRVSAISTSRRAAIAGLDDNRNKKIIGGPLTTIEQFIHDNAAFRPRA